MAEPVTATSSVTTVVAPRYWRQNCTREQAEAFIKAHEDVFIDHIRLKDITRRLPKETVELKLLITLLFSGQHDFPKLFEKLPVTYPDIRIDLSGGYENAVVHGLPPAEHIFPPQTADTASQYLLACHQLNLFGYEFSAELLDYANWIKGQMGVHRWHDPAILIVIWHLVPERRGEWYPKALRAHEDRVYAATRYVDLLSTIIHFCGVGALILLKDFKGWSQVQDDALCYTLYFLEDHDVLAPLTTFLQYPSVSAKPFDRSKTTLEKYLRKTERRWRSILVKKSLLGDDGEIMEDTMTSD